MTRDWRGFTGGIGSMARHGARSHIIGVITAVTVLLVALSVGCAKAYAREACVPLDKVVSAFKHEFRHAKLATYTGAAAAKLIGFVGGQAILHGVLRFPPDGDTMTTAYSADAHDGVAIISMKGCVTAIVPARPDIISKVFRIFDGGGGDGSGDV